MSESISVRVIEVFAFNRCNQLMIVILNDVLLEEIGARAFLRCTSLELEEIIVIAIHNYAVRAIKVLAFSGCSGLTC
jgi:hypothetical protein